MSIPPSERDYSNQPREAMDFIETTQYTTTTPSAPGGSRRPVPESWREYRHPNGDTYFHNHHLRLTTPDDVRDPQTLEYIIEAKDDHLQCLAGDPNRHRLPTDYEMVISDVSENAAVIRMYSRSATAAYTWTEETGLVEKGREHFWSHVAEYPAHHRHLPANTEQEFVGALQNAKASISNGVIFPFSEQQIDQIIARYQQLSAHRREGRNVTPSLAWLVGAVMPLDAIGRRVDQQNLAAAMNGLHF